MQKKTLFLLLLMGCTVFCFSGRVAAEQLTIAELQERGVVFFPLGNQELLLIVRAIEEGECHWFFVQEFATQKLGINLSSLMDVADISASPDGKYLAVISVGEGHPILEVVDLTILKTSKEYRVLRELNPYPGTINLRQWQGENLLIESDMLLTLNQGERETKTEEDLLLAEPRTFSLHIPSGTISATLPATEPRTDGSVEQK